MTQRLFSFSHLNLLRRNYKEQRSNYVFHKKLLQVLLCCIWIISLTYFLESTRLWALNTAESHLYLFIYNFCINTGVESPSPSRIIAIKVMIAFFRFFFRFCNVRWKAMLGALLSYKSGCFKLREWITTFDWIKLRAEGCSAPFFRSLMRRLFEGALFRLSTLCISLWKHILSDNSLD